MIFFIFCTSLSFHLVFFIYTWYFFPSNAFLPSLFASLSFSSSSFLFCFFLLHPYLFFPGFIFTLLSHSTFIQLSTFLVFKILSNSYYRITIKDETILLKLRVIRLIFVNFVHKEPPFLMALSAGLCKRLREDCAWLGCLWAKDTLVRYQIWYGSSEKKERKKKRSSY